jgi:hypothetical protein
MFTVYMLLNHANTGIDVGVVNAELIAFDVVVSSIRTQMPSVMYWAPLLTALTACPKPWLQLIRCWTERAVSALSTRPGKFSAIVEFVLRLGSTINLARVAEWFP